jgi:hypothetical protein
MKLSKLIPQPQKVQAFKLNRLKFVPDCSGCYVLTNFSNDILYVGLANNLQNRMKQHLDDPRKTSETSIGRAVLFHWIEHQDLNKIERTWLNIHVEHEGKYPVLNKIFSPTAS